MAPRRPALRFGRYHGRSILTAGQRLDSIMATTTTTAPSPRAPTTSGTYFLSLTVENVRCFGPAQTLDLSDGHGRPSLWTVILGENGLGKTTLLSCLAGIAGTRLQSDGIVAIWGAPGDWEDLARGAGDVEGRAKAAICLTDGSRTEAELEFKKRGKVILLRSIPLGPVVLCYGASRRMPQRMGLAADEKRSNLFLDNHVVLRDPEDWLLKADYNARLSGHDAKRFDYFAQRVREALTRILPEVTDIRIQPAEEPGGSPRVEAKTPDGWVPLRRLGFGYQSQIAWLVDFASRMFERHPDSPDPLAEPAVVLVDEIDLHMHPRWQRQIVAYLTERCPNTQFIVTAHSPLVVQAAADANIVLLRREGDHVVIENDPEVLSNWRVDQILTSELFGLDSARPPQIEAQLKERRALLAKPKLTSRDRKRLDRLQAQIGELPAGESAEDRRAMELIRRAASKLQSGA
jgi:energy-coupling factor transporter ATP-binding protein EcfA2